MDAPVVKPKPKKFVNTRTEKGTKADLVAAGGYPWGFGALAAGAVTPHAGFRHIPQHELNEHYARGSRWNNLLGLGAGAALAGAGLFGHDWGNFDAGTWATPEAAAGATPGAAPHHFGWGHVANTFGGDFGKGLLLGNIPTVAQGFMHGRKLLKEYSPPELSLRREDQVPLPTMRLKAPKTATITALRPPILPCVRLGGSPTATEHKTAEVGDEPKPLKMQPLAHQQRVSDRLKQMPENGPQKGLLVHHGIGTGKTLTAINAAHQHNLPLVAVVPAALRNNFHKELAASGTKVPATVLSYNEAQRRANDPAFREQVRNSLVVYDEAHRMGRHESARSHLPKLLPAKKTLLLTGSPLRNHPSEIAPLVNAVAPGRLPSDPREFDKMFVKKIEKSPGLLGRLRGVKPGIERVPQNLHKFRKAVEGTFDYHANQDRSAYPTYAEDIRKVPMTAKQQAAYEFTLGKYPALAYKIRHGIPPSRDEEGSFSTFLTGPRQISNHPGSFNASATHDDAPKFRIAADEVQKRFKTDPRFRGVIYSNFLESGVHPMQEELKRRGINSVLFTGQANDAERKQIVDAYNKGKAPVLLVSGAGAEGLDLKGTKLMQIMEPHWNEALLDQVRGRAIRYKSHSHLPENERHVEVQRFHAVPKSKRNLIQRIFRAPEQYEKGVDDYLHSMAQSKRKLIEPFLKELSAPHAPVAAPGKA